MSTPTDGLPLADLVEWAHVVATEVREGRHTVRADPDERWHVRLHADADLDVWLISWTEDQGTQLHDHGGSRGVFTVVRGTLDELVWHEGTGTLRSFERDTGDTVAFAEPYVHDVRNTQPSVAVSVHVYSPPLTQMAFHDVEGGRLRRLAHVWTDDPEEPLPARLPEAS